MIRAKATSVALALALALSIGGLHGAAAAGEANPWEHYEILIERNMFSRSRGQRSQPEEAEVVRAAPSPERFVLLRGVLRQDDEFIAVLEDMRSGGLIRARVGDEVVRGRVDRITLDGIRYVRDEAQVEVGIGDNLEASGTAASAAAGEGTAGEELETTTLPAGSAADIVEQMRQRRQREQGQ